eukprot:4516365-Pyramimonas_sp.AAC.1
MRSEEHSETSRGGRGLFPSSALCAAHPLTPRGGRHTVRTCRASGMCIPDAQHVRAPLRTRIVLGGSGGNGEKRAEAPMGPMVSSPSMGMGARVDAPLTCLSSLSSPSFSSSSASSFSLSFSSSSSSSFLLLLLLLLLFLLLP